MRTLIAGRLIFALIGLAVVAVPVIVIKGVVMDKVDEATKAAGFENVPANPTDIGASREPLPLRELRPGHRDAAGEGRPEPELLKVGVLPYMVEFQIKDGERAKGYRYYAGNGEMGEFKVKIIGSGSIEARSSRSRRSTTRSRRARDGRQGRGRLAAVTNMTSSAGSSTATSPGP